ncbi:TadE family protein [Paenibacillus tengchongensis]|uniref:TadE family protein n=1 Tax=Paenibacillus tengchongensis TaxID=2608684 RepID=UPI001FE7FCD9|nr:TadE family protein [Paenibacillus tengchongensis]
MNMKAGDDEGSFTVEASMLLPILMGITLLLLFFGLYTYQRSMLLQVASLASERTSYNWDNSNKAPDGSFAPGESDSLYWRLADDRLVASLFGTSSGASEAKATLPVQNETGNLVKMKLRKGTAAVPANMPGEVQYQYGLTGRSVGVSLRRMLNLPVLDGLLSDGADPGVAARSAVAEPAEFIRTVELMRYFGAKFQRNPQSNSPDAGMDQREAGQMLSKLH